jgi:hypothetical protein
MPAASIGVLRVKHVVDRKEFPMPRETPAPQETRTLWLCLEESDDGANEERAYEISREQRDFLDQTRISLGARLAVFPKTSSGHVPQALYRVYHAMVEAWQEAEDLVNQWDGV